MKVALFVILCFFGAHALLAQPFRYIHGNEIDRDSIRLLGIKGYVEFEEMHENSKGKQLVHKVDYDRNGNLLKDWRLNVDLNVQNQWTYCYSADNLLLEHATYFPDTLTLNQRFIYHYDKHGNQTKAITEFYNLSKLASSSTVTKIYDSLGHCIEMKTFGNNGIVTSHYGFVYNAFGKKIQEIVFSPNGEVLYKREVFSISERDEQPYGFPSDPDAELEELLREHIQFNSDGTKTVENGYDIRVFDENGILIYWQQKKFKDHWFDYSFY